MSETFAWKKPFLAKTLVAALMILKYFSPFRVFMVFAIKLPAVRLTGENTPPNAGKPGEGE
jgi:hypothetical protein